MTAAVKISDWRHRRPIWCPPCRASAGGSNPAPAGAAVSSLSSLLLECRGHPVHILRVIHQRPYFPLREKKERRIRESVIKLFDGISIGDSNSAATARNR